VTQVEGMKETCPSSKQTRVTHRLLTDKGWGSDGDTAPGTLPFRRNSPPGAGGRRGPVSSAVFVERTGRPGAERGGRSGSFRPSEVAPSRGVGTNRVLRADGGGDPR